jgi:triosephosphate isomerase
MDPRAAAFLRLLKIMDELREQCPWDRKQTMETLRPLTIEETYELGDAILKNDLVEVRKELGDLLLHMVFYARIGEEKGAFTGELAPNMVKEFCGYVIIGHSERRALFGETDEHVNRKLRAAMKAGLIPIVCVGETLDEYESGRTGEVVSRQIKLGFADVDSASASRIVVAYEPVWAIGTGKASSGENANGVVRQVIRRALSEAFNENVAQSIRVLYGGSVTASNASEFFSQPEIDGALVGGASLKPDEFVAIAKAASGR